MNPSLKTSEQKSDILSEECEGKQVSCNHINLVSVTKLIWWSILLGFKWLWRRPGWGRGIEEDRWGTRSHVTRKWEGVCWGWGSPSGGGE